MKWDELTGLKALQTAAEKCGFRGPTPVQEQTWQKVVEGKDLCVRAQTGSGKTLAYLMPLFEKYKDCPRENKILILVPTHELAMQVAGQAQMLAERSGIGLRAVVIVGNVNITRQIDKLKEKPQIIIGTGGRVLELIQKRKIAAHLIRTVVLDEGDKLFDNNNRQTTDAVIKCMLRDRQLLLYSASMSARTVECLKAWSAAAEELTVESERQVPKNIKHWYVVVEPRYKLETLRGLVTAIRTRKAMIFINKTGDIEEAAAKLLHHHYEAEYIHGGRDKEERKKAIQSFRSGKVKYLIATDIAARGLHFDRIDTVFHVSIPENPQDYLHRAGRTGRSGESGRNILIVSKGELPLLRKYEKELGIKMEEKYYHRGKLQNEKPEEPPFKKPAK